MTASVITTATATPGLRLRAWMNSQPGPVQAVTRLLDTGIGPATLDAILAGSIGISAVTARRLEGATGIPAEDWTRYQTVATHRWD
jgi:plasmid maintenance system antidote protein VapI